MKKILAPVVLATLCVAGIASAQTIRPRGAASAAPAVTPAPKPAADQQSADQKAIAEAEAAKAKTPEGKTGLNITGTLPAKFEAGRRLTTTLKVAGGKAPYYWEFDGPQNNEIVAIGRAHDFYATPADQSSNIEFVWWVPRTEGQVKSKITVTDSSDPTVSTTREFTVALTPFVPSPADTYNRTLKAQEDLAGLTEQVRQTRNAGIAKINEATTQIRNEMRRPNSELNTLINSKLTGVLNQVDAKINANIAKYTSWTFLGLMALAFIILTIISVIGGTMIARRVPFFRRMAPMFIIGVVLFGANTASAQTATPKVAPACTIRSIPTGSVVVKEQDAAAITIAVRNCKDVKSITTSDAAITFTGDGPNGDVVTKGNTVTAKVAATAAALTGPTLFKITLADGTEIASPDAVYILVLDTATAVVRRDAAAATARVAAEAKKATVATAQVAAKVENLDKIAAGLGAQVTAATSLAASRMTKEEVTAAVAVLATEVDKKLVTRDARLENLERALMNLDARLDDTDANVDAIKKVRIGTFKRATIGEKIAGK